MELSLIERAFAPVGAGLILVDLDIEQPLERVVVTQLEWLAQHRTGNLRVDQGFRDGADGVLQYFHVFRAAVEQFQDAGVLHHTQQRVIGLHGERIEQPGGFAIGNLDQTQISAVGAFPDKLGVDAENVTIHPAFLCFFELCK